MSRWRQAGTLRILDFDSECRPLSYMGPDYTSGEVTAIACSWIGEKEIRCWLLGRETADEMLNGFLDLYEQAEMVTGHNIRSHDLPIISGALIEHGFGRLPAKLTQDTLRDLLKHKYLPASQEALAAMCGLAEPKKHMTQTGWRKANRMTPEGIAETEARAVSDVRQHKALRAKLLDAGVLRTPRVWTA